jgi:glycosyltransferase involved in cell wall biosynthesis
MAASAHPPLFCLTHEFYPRRGGIATYVEEIAAAATTLGREVEVWAPAAAPGNEKPWPFRLRRLPLKGTHDWGCRLRLARELVAQRRRFWPATVWLAEPGPILAMLLLDPFRIGRPGRLILTFHGSEILKFHRNPVTRRLVRRLIRRADRVSVLTPFIRQLLLAHFPEAGDKLAFSPGAPRSNLALAPRPASDGKDKTIILTVGRLHPRKGQIFVIEALRALPPEVRAGIEYWIAGDTGRPDYAEQLRAAAAGADFSVRFFGNVADDALDGLYRRADLFALTSVNLDDSIEGFGLVYLDAGAHGLPVVGHDVGGVSEAVTDGATGLLVPPHRPPLLTAAFARLIADPALRRKLGEAGRDRAGRCRWTDAAGALFTFASTSIFP